MNFSNYRHLLDGKITAQKTESKIIDEGLIVDSLPSFVSSSHSA